MNPTNMKLSVIIPTRNEELSIKDVLINLRKEIPNGTELIVVDGNSTDKTVAIAKRYAKVIPNKGRNIASARNTGAKTAKGDILVFVDADTKPTRIFFEKTIKAFQDKQTVCFGGLIMPTKLNAYEWLLFRTLNVIVQLSVAFGRPAIAGSCVAYRRTSFVKVKGFDEGMAASEDQDLCNRVSKIGRVKFDSSLIIDTSNRRLRELGFWGLIVNWSGTTFNLLIGKKTTEYKLTHSVK